MSERTYDLAIVGGGIGGSALATVMQRAGFSCLVLERTREFRGRYHVLGGALDPLSGVGPDQLRIRELLARIGNQEDGVDVSEVIIATDPNTEGEATATYLVRMLRDFPGLTVSRLASGLPMGGDLEFADELTLGRALSGRRTL